MRASRVSGVPGCAEAGSEKAMMKVVVVDRAERPRSD